MLPGLGGRAAAPSELSLLTMLFSIELASTNANGHAARSLLLVVKSKVLDDELMSVSELLSPS